MLLVCVYVSVYYVCVCVCFVCHISFIISLFLQFERKTNFSVFISSTTYYKTSS